MISGFGCLFCWEASHNVLLWSSYSEQSEERWARANSSGEKEQISPGIWNLNGCPIKQTAGIALCTCRKQLILIPSCLGGSCLDWCQQHIETKDKGEHLRRCSWTFWLLLTSRHLSLLWPRRRSTTISLAARKCCSLCHNKAHRTEMEWERGHLILCQAICSDLSIQFKWPKLLWSTKTLRMTFFLMSFIFQAQSLVDRACCCCSSSTRETNDVWDPTAWFVIWSKQIESINAVCNAVLLGGFAIWNGLSWLTF